MQYSGCKGQRAVAGPFTNLNCNYSEVISAWKDTFVILVLQYVCTPKNMYKGVMPLAVEIVLTLFESV